MNFLNRLKFYLIGVGLGILMVLAIFKDRKLTSWTPANQVIKEIKEKPLIINTRVECLLNCVDFPNSDSLKSALTGGDIDFSKSEVKDHEKRTYIVEMGGNAIEEAHLIIFRDSIVISEIRLKNTSCDCQ